MKKNAPMLTYRNLLAALLLLAVLPAPAQHYVRTRHNIGFTAGYTPADYTLPYNHFKERIAGSALQAGVTKQYGVLFPELFYTQTKGPSYHYSESTTPPQFTSHNIGAGLTMKLDLFPITEHKRGGYCFGRMLTFNAGADYVHAVKTTGLSSDLKTRGELGVKAGLGMYSVWGGSSKKHQSWTIHWETYARYGVSPYMVHPTSMGEEPFHHATAGLTLRIIHHKTYKFSEM